ncbi:molybdenum cofactor biosynthesis protein [Aquibacillus halophilus]|uniref:Molybdenum cofactor biosynthesis protein B n=1 Tax=Aquibacillus halophilus TaxID=930132 RepID=A0A6A8DFU4_9BACI|nr:MogA/MoaB family molybdenum cofactor biosynthesis protein [Aquibacillus halophilus]MRH44558.1 molybdenum cofactor biosynthesis protein [Aquibacillus halophilus]
MLEKHRKVSAKSVNCTIITVSDTRTEENDKSGQLIKKLLTEQGHVISDYTIVHDEQDEINRALEKATEDSGVAAVILNGGTGIAKRDVTIEVVQSSLDKEIPGFGELFRMLSYQKDIGSAALLSRAIAGVINNTAVFSIPGSSGAVRLAMNDLILPELGHIVMEVEKDN